MVKERKQFLVMDMVEVGGKMHPLVVPIEWEVTHNMQGWSINSVDIKVENARTLTEAVQIYTSMLQECIIAGQIQVNMNPYGDFN